MKVEGQSGGELQFFPENPVVGDSVVISLTQDYGQNASYHWYFGDSYFPNTILLLDENQAVTSSNSVVHLYSQPGVVSVRVKIITGMDTIFLNKALLIKESEPNPCLCIQNQMCDYISNGSFECHTSEPWWSGQIGFACPWLTTEAGADLYSISAAPQNPAWPYWWQVPESHFGFQIPYPTNTLTSYAGFVAENHLNYSQLDKRREYLYQKLSRPLTPGVTYEVSMKVSLAEGSTIYSPVGMFLTNINPVNNHPVLPNAFYTNVPNQNAQGFVIQSTHHINNTNWEVVSGYITPTTSDIEYIIISKFNDTPCTEFSVRTPDPNYWPVPVNSNPGSGSYDLAYYFVDDVQINPVDFNYDVLISGYKNCCTNGTQYTASLVNNNLFYKWEILPTGLNCGTILPSNSGFGLSTVTINWNEPNFPANSEYVTLQLTISDGCVEKTVDLKVYKCCHENSSTVLLHNYTITANNTLTIPDYAKVEINGELKVYGNFILEADNLIGVWMGSLAKITVYPGATMTVLGKVSFSMLCHAFMWDGIYSVDPTSFVSFQGNFSGEPNISDAINGIVSENGGKISVFNTNFNQNYNSISIRNYLPNQPNFQGPLDAQISGCSFTMNPLVPGIPNVLNYEPYDGEKSNAGIFIQSAEVKIGEIGQGPNNFENLQRGIYSINSITEVLNANFKNIPPEEDYFYSWPYKQAGILSLSNQEETPSTISPILTAGSLNSGLTFIDCFVGISAQNTKADVFSGNFTDCRTPIHVLNPLFPSYIIGNLIQKGNLNPVYDITGTGISVISANPGTSDAVSKVLIKDNSITGMRTGIHCVNQNATVSYYPTENQVVLNDIHFKAPCLSNNYRSGIRIEGCDGINIVDNIVDYEGWTPDEQQRHRGLSIKKSQGAFVSENSFTKLDAGIFTNGELQKTLFFCNTFDRCWNGFYFGEGTAMTDQAVYVNGERFCTNNRWIGNYGPTGNQFQMTQNTSVPPNLIDPFRWYYDAVTTDPEYLLDPELLGGQHPCYTVILPLPETDPFSICNMENYGMDSTNPPMDSVRRSQLFRDLLMGLIEYDTLKPQNRFFEKDFVYIYLLNHPEAITLGAADDIEFQEFMDSITNTDADLIQQVYRFLQNSKLDSAALVNDGLSGNEIWTANRKLVNAYYMQYWAGSEYDISEDDSLALLSIALQTPYEGGDAVYTARCLLNLFDVETMGTAYSAAITQNTAPKLRVWPNPANTEIHIEIPGELPDQITIEFFSPDGRLIERLNPKIVSNVFSVNTSAILNGCYFVQIKSKDVLIGIQKVCLIH